MFCVKGKQISSCPGRRVLSPRFFRAHLVRTKQSCDTVFALIRLETFKERRRIMQDRRRRVEVEGPVRLDLGGSPARLRVPGDAEHCRSREVSVGVTQVSRISGKHALWSVNCRPKTSFDVSGISFGFFVSSISSCETCEVNKFASAHLLAGKAMHLNVL